MPRRWTEGREHLAARALTVLVAIGACVAAAAYAAARPAANGSAVARKAAAARVPRPRITRHPEAVTASPNARFAFSVGRRHLRFQCRLDQGQWRACAGSLVLRRLGVGEHRFSVRALDRFARHGAAASFGWERVEPKPFSIDPRPAAIGPLFPGAAPVPVPVVLSNPNSVTLLVTAVGVSVTSAPPGCDGNTNLELLPAGVSAGAPLRVPAGVSVELPAPGVSAPAIALRDLPFPQDACQGARFGLAFSGEAHG